MKIICTVTNDLTYDRRMHRICTSLQNAGHDVVLVGRKLKHSKPLQDYIFKQKRIWCFFTEGKFFYLEYNLRLFFWLLWSRFDAVCSVDLDTILPGYFISKWKGKKCIYDAHEYFTEVPEVVDRPFTKNIWERVARITVPKVDAAYTVSSTLAEELSKKYNRPFGLVRNVPFRYQSILEQDFETAIQKYSLPSLAEQKVTTILLYQGALNEGRGIEELLEAMVSLKNCELWLAGEGDLSQVLRQLAKQLLLDKKVKFLGFVPPEDLTIITRMANIGLNLLELKGLSYYYSLANKTFDYVQAEIPALHMNFPEYQFLIKKYGIGLLIENLETQNIIKAIEQLTQNKDLYQSIVENCRKAKEELIWEEEEKNLIDNY